MKQLTVAQVVPDVPHAAVPWSGSRLSNRVQHQLLMCQRCFCLALRVCDLQPVFCMTASASVAQQLADVSDGAIRFRHLLPGAAGGDDVFLARKLRSELQDVLPDVQDVLCLAHVNAVYDNKAQLVSNNDKLKVSSQFPVRQ